MRKHVIMAGLLAGVCLLAGCSSSSSKKETEKATEAKTAAAVEAQTEEAASEAAGESVAEVSVDGEAETEVSTEAESSEYVELGDRPTYTASDYVTVGEYVGLAVEADAVNVTEEDIDSAISSAVAASGSYDTLTEGTVESGDIANIDYVGKKDDVAFDGGTAEGYDLTIGSGTFIPGFEDGLIGVAIGDTVDLDLTFPENYGNTDLAGAQVVFTVTVNSVQRAQELSDELISTMTDGEYTTIDAYRTYQEETLTAAAEETQENTILNELMTQLYNTCSVDSYPEELVAYSINEMNNYYVMYAEAYGMSLDDFVTLYFGMDRETYDAQAEEAVRSSIQQELILTAIAEAEEMTISDEEYADGCQKYADQLGYSLEDFQSAYDEAKIRSSLIMDKAMDYVRENAVITIIEETETEAVTEGIEETEAAEEEAVTEAAEEDEAVTEAVTE